MSIKLMSAIFDTEMRDLPYEKNGETRKAKASTAKIVLLALADHANDYGESCYPGYDKMEVKTGLSRQGLADTYDALVQNGILTVEYKASRLHTNDYNINIRAFPGMSDLWKDLPDTVKPLDSRQSSGLTETVKPLDHNHQLTISNKKTNINTNEPKTENVTHQRPDFRSLNPADYRKIPELRTFMDATHWIPGSFVLEVVYDFVHAGLTGEAIAAAFKEWTARGYKPSNVKGYLEWARDGIPATPKNHKKFVQPTPPPQKGFAF